jgi:hypothetical protein
MMRVLIACLALFLALAWASCGDKPPVKPTPIDEQTPAPPPEEGPPAGPTQVGSGGGFGG